MKKNNVEQAISYDYWAKNQNKKNTTTYDNIIARHTSIEEAVFLKRFIWHYENHKHESKGWVFIVPKAFTMPVGMSMYSFRKIVKKWEDLKILRTVTKGLPLKKYYHLNEEKLAHYLTQIYNLEAQTIDFADLIENDNQSYRKREDYLIENEKIINPYKIEDSDKELLRNSYHRDREAGRGLKGEFSLLGKDKNWKIRWGVKIQNKLKIQAVKGNSHYNVSPVTWGKKIDYLIQKVGVTKENFIKVMTWYLQDTTLKQKYTPKIRRPEDLVTKWSGILDAYDKDKNEKLLASRNPDDQGVWTETIKNPDGTWTSIIHYPENFHDNL